MGIVIPSEEDRFWITVQTLQREVQELRNKPFRVPTLQADPDIKDPTNLWYLSDGRLRGRLVDGTVVEYSRSNHSHPNATANSQGGSSSTAPPPPQDYQPASYQYKQIADWVASYEDGGASQRSTSYLYYGYYSGAASRGVQMSMLHFPNLSQLDPGPVGTRIARVQLRLINRHTNLNSGAELRIGLHNSATKPTSFQEVYWLPYKVHVGKAGYPASGSTDITFDIPLLAGEKFRDDTACGITFSQHTSDQSFYGYAESYAELIIDYVK